MAAKFDFDHIYPRLLREHADYYGKPLPDTMKKSIKKARKLWHDEDEHEMFLTLIRCKFKDREIPCPKCGHRVNVPERYKRWKRVLDTGRPVRVEPARTLSCEHCSFSFNPLAWTVYGDTKLDLRVYIFYMWMTDDCKIEYPIAAVARIFGISIGAARSLVRNIEASERGETSERIRRKAQRLEEKGDVGSPRMRAMFSAFGTPKEYVDDMVEQQRRERGTGAPNA